MSCRDSKFIATTLKPCKNSHTEHKSSVPLRALLLVANGEHSIFNKPFVVFCICPWHSTSGRETALCMCTNQMFVTEVEAVTMKKVSEWAALLIGAAMLLDHIPSDWKGQCPEK